MMTLEVDIATQTMHLMQHGKCLETYSISTAKNGPGERRHSEQTPRGWHVIRAKIGADCPANTIFVGRRTTGEVYSPELKALHPQRDWILTRILWLSGLELGKNRLGEVDTMRRYIYIHGTPDEVPLGVPGSKGCIRMRNENIMALFDKIPVGTHILIR